VQTKFELPKFLTNSSVHHVLATTGEEVTGITILCNELFVVRNTSQVFVYSSTGFTLTSNIPITASQQLRSIVSCPHYNCLYVVDPGQSKIYKYDLSKDATSQWSVREDCRALSVTKNDHLLVTLHANRIEEYTTTGSFRRRIRLDSSLACPRRCVQQSTGNYAVCDLGDDRHRVCIVDTSGHIIQSYGRSHGSGVGQLNYPCHLAVDIDDNVLVADGSNNRLQLLSPTLTYLGDIVILGHELDDPYTVYVDELNQRLYIGEYDGGRIFVLQVQEKLDLTQFLINSSVVNVVPTTGKSVSGITVLGREVFVVRYTSEVFVYNSTSFTSISNISIPGSQLRKIVSCSHYNCLYAIDSKQRLVYRHDLSNNVTTNWSVSGECWALSLTKCYNVLITLYSNRFQEYTTDGCFIRQISLVDCMDCLMHCVQLSTGNFVVCHFGRNHRVCIVDPSGHIILSYGTSNGSGVGQLNYPCHLAVDTHDNVLVADCNNNRVQLLSPSLTYLGDLVIPGHQLNKPATLHVNELNHRLYIGEFGGERIFVLRVNKPSRRGTYSSAGTTRTSSCV